MRVDTDMLERLSRPMEQVVEDIELTGDWDIHAEEMSLEWDCCCDQCCGWYDDSEALLEWVERVRPWVKYGPGHPLADLYDGIADMFEKEAK